MKWFRWIEHPRLLVLLTAIFALLPAGLAVITYRDARRKDERLHETTAQMLSEQLQRETGRLSYYLTQLRQRAAKLTDKDIKDGKLNPPNLEWHDLLPHLIAYGYAARLDDGRLVTRLHAEAHAPGRDSVLESEPGFARNPVVAPLLAWKPGDDRAAILGCQPEDGRLLVLCAVPSAAYGAPPRGYVFGWINLDALCRDPALPLIHDQILFARALAPGETPPDEARVVVIGDEPPRWRAAIFRGPRFTERFGPPTPWIAFIAVGLSAVPLLGLGAFAVRASRLRADLAAEREAARQQRFFTQSVSHEFRTPLGVILSGVELLESYSDRLPPERRTEIVEEIRTHIRRMTDLISEVLLLGRLESGRMAFQPQSTNPLAVCDTFARQCEIASGHRNPVRVEAPENGALIDAALLGAILGNLLSNAVKYSPAGSPVSLVVSRSGPDLVFAVQDRGIGIPESELSRVFDAFHRCSNVGDTPGAGLGLAIVQRAVKMHGGSIRINSQAGSGSEFIVTLRAPPAPPE